MDKHRSLLTLSNTSKSYRNTTVVHPFNLSVRPGEIIALCGGNGAGKSTIIKMISGIVQPSTGTITLNGFTWKKNRKQYASQLGYMPDDFHFQQPLSIQEFLLFYADLKRVSRKRVDELIALVGLEDKRKDSVMSLSKGMRQRLTLAQAMLAEPKLILMDEPTNGLDPNWITGFIQILHSIRDQGQSILFSTHNLAVAQKAADQVIYLEHGKVIQHLFVKEDTEKELTNLFNKA